MTRIKLEDSWHDIMINMSDGNPGGLNVLLELFTKTEKIDPDSLLKHAGGILFLDTLGIYGSYIWILYKDYCGRDLVKMIALLRACAMGFVNPEEIKNAVRYEDADSPLRFQATEKFGGMTLDEIVKKMEETLPNFNKKAA